MAGNFGLQVAVLALVTLLAVVTHVIGSGFLLHAVRLNTRRLHHARPWPIQAATVSAFIFGLIVLHALTILGFAVAFLALGALPDLETAVYFSAASYATVGDPEVSPNAWRLLGAGEGLVGFVLIGWSTALFISAMLRIWSEDHKWFDAD